MKLHEDVIGAIGEEAVPLRAPEDIAGLAQRLKDKRVVMLGEATHGTAEFYRLRAELSLRLVREHGFAFVAVEGDWPDAARLRRYIRGREGRSAREVLGLNHRWPRWMWANEEAAELGESLRAQGTPFYGLDIYSLFESMDAVLAYLKKENPFLARRLVARYACFDSFGRDEIAYARSLLEYPPGCEAEVEASLQDLLRFRVEHARQGDAEELFDAQQSARIVRNAESYYRAMLLGDTHSWNVRDEHMLEMLEILLNHHAPGSKAIVWAHNTHVGDYRATEMWSEGYVNLGGLARQRLGAHEVALVGFGTYEGKVMAGRSWGAPEEEMVLPAAQSGSVDECFHVACERAGMESCYLAFDGWLRRGEVFAQRLGQRAVGVVYDPRHERRGQYVPTSLSGRYDAFVFVDRTTAVHPIAGELEYGDVPETWPMGQ